MPRGTRNDAVAMEHVGVQPKDPIAQPIDGCHHRQAQRHATCNALPARMVYSMVDPPKRIHLHTFKLIEACGTNLCPASRTAETTHRLGVQLELLRAHQAEAALRIHLSALQNGRTDFGVFSVVAPFECQFGGFSVFQYERFPP